MFKNLTLIEEMKIFKYKYIFKAFLPVLSKYNLFIKKDPTISTI